MKFNLRNIIVLILTIAISILSVAVHFNSINRQKIAFENAEIKNVKYGLLSVHSWKRQVSEIVALKIKEFELTSENRKELRVEIEKALHQLLNEVEIILKEKTQKGGFFKRTLTSIIQPFVVNIEDLRKRIPAFTTIILDELNNYKTREKLRKVIQSKIDDYLSKTVGEEDLSKIDVLTEKYACNNAEETSVFLQNKLDKQDKVLKQKALIIVLLSVFSFLIILVKNKTIKAFDIFLLLIILSILLLIGVSTPMIDIDARIKDFSFQLLGEPIKFQNQILFYQSKSIFGVVKILIKTAQYQSILVGLLIFLFSIIFPISKLLSSFGVLLKQTLVKNKMISFFAFKSSKWAMADVIVVAIFMSYIGFSGVISSQLKQLESHKENIDILTTDNSNFGVGFFLFLTFAVGGLFLASKIEKMIIER